MTIDGLLTVYGDQSNRGWGTYQVFPSGEQVHCKGFMGLFVLNTTKVNPFNTAETGSLKVW
jgi:hypothetical protein